MAEEEQEKDDLFQGESSIAEIAEIDSNSRRMLDKLIDKKNPWGYNYKGLTAKQAAMRMLATSTGMYARVPITCKGEECPYAEQCQLLPYDMAPVGEYCPIETSQIELRVTQYMKDIDIDSASFTDRALVDEIVQCDILLERCKALMAREGSPVIQMSIGIDNEGNEITQPGVSKAWEAYERISKKRNDAYQLLMLTRKDHKNDGDTQQKSLSEILAEADDVIDNDADDNK